MGVQKISISLDDEILDRARAAATFEGVALSTWLSRAAAEAADLAGLQRGWEEYFATYGEPSVAETQQTVERMTSDGHFEPESPEHVTLRTEALARLSEPPSDDDTINERGRRAG